MKDSWSSAHEAELCQLNKTGEAMLNKCIILKIYMLKIFFKVFKSKIRCTEF